MNLQFISVRLEMRKGKSAKYDVNEMIMVKECDHRKRKVFVQWNKAIK